MTHIYFASLLNVNATREKGLFVLTAAKRLDTIQNVCADARQRPWCMVKKSNRHRRREARGQSRPRAPLEQREEALRLRAAHTPLHSRQRANAPPLSPCCRLVAPRGRSPPSSPPPPPPPPLPPPPSRPPAMAGSAGGASAARGRATSSAAAAAPAPAARMTRAAPGRRRHHRRRGDALRELALSSRSFSLPHLRCRRRVLTAVPPPSRAADAGPAHHGRPDDVARGGAPLFGAEAPADLSPQGRRSPDPQAHLRPHGRRRRRQLGE